MILIGIYTRNTLTAVTASARQPDGSVEKGVFGLVAGDVFLAMAEALEEAQAVRCGAIQVFTNNDELVSFLTPPIMVRPTATEKVKKRWGRTVEVVEVPTGGNANQWRILHGLFAIGSYGRDWSVKRAASLPGTEALLDEYIASGGYTETTERGLSGCARRIDAGIWTNP